MNPWDLILTLLGWLVFVPLVLFAALVVVIVFLSVVHLIKTSIPKKQKKPYPADQPKPTARQDDFLAEATVVAKAMYGDDSTLRVNVFRDGARWAWHAFNRRES